MRKTFTMTIEAKEFVPLCNQEINHRVYNNNLMLILMFNNMDNYWVEFIRIIQFQIDVDMAISMYITLIQASYHQYYKIFTVPL